MNFFSKVIYALILGALILFLTGGQTTWAEETEVIIYFSRCPDITSDQSLTENNFILEPNLQQTFFLVVGLGFPNDNRFLVQIITNLPIAGQSIIQIGAANVAVIRQSQ